MVTHVCHPSKMISSKVSWSYRVSSSQPGQLSEILSQTTKLKQTSKKNVTLCTLGICLPAMGDIGSSGCESESQQSEQSRALETGSLLELIVSASLGNF